MSRGRDNVSFMPEVEEVNPRDRSPSPDGKPRKGGRKIGAPDDTPSNPTVIMTPQSPGGAEDRQPSPEPQPQPKKRRNKKDENELVLGILNMIMSRVDNNTHTINKFVLKKFEEDDKSTAVRSDKVPVDVRVIFMKVIDVDTLEQKFRAEIFVQARWLEPKLKNFSDKQLGRFTGEGIWTPRIIVTNMVGDPDEDDTWYVATRYPDFKYPAVTMRRKITGYFSEILELNDFPLDVQELTVQISSRRSEREVVLRQDEYRMSTVNIDGFLDQDQFELFPHVMTSTGHVSSELTSLRDRHSAVYFSCSVKRKAAYFFWNIFMMMFVISTLAFTAFSIPATNPHNRLAVSLTLLLTAIAFKFIINKSIPQIPYLTYLDIYVMGCMVMLALHAVEHAVITAWAGWTTQRETDQFMMYFLATCHVSFNVAFTIFLIVMNRKANQQVRERNKEYAVKQELTTSKRKKLKKQVDDDMYSPVA